MVIFLCRPVHVYIKPDFTPDQISYRTRYKVSYAQVSQTNTKNIAHINPQSVLLAFMPEVNGQTHALTHYT